MSRVQSVLRRVFSRAQPGILTRDFIAQSLYAPRVGYFADAAVVVSPPPVPFNALVGKADVDARVSALLAAPGARRGWLTPSELFSPHYGRAVARFLLARHARLKPPAPLVVYEVGPGSGRHAGDVLRGDPEVRGWCWG